MRNSDVEQNSSMDKWWQSSHICGGNFAYIEELYEAYLQDPGAIPKEWYVYFENLPRVNGSPQETSHSNIRHQFLQLAKMGRVTTAPVPSESGLGSEHERKQIRVLQLASAYRFRGHQKANLDPLGLMARERVEDLGLDYHNLGDEDFNTEFDTTSLFIGHNKTSLKELVSIMEKTYCESVGAEYMHIVNTDEKKWLQKRLEEVHGHPVYTQEVKKHLLERLSAAEGLEKYLGSRYPGTKRFGLEGGESLIPLLDELIQLAGTAGGKEIVIGMAHRGRLNVLVNILGKKPSELFDEFEGKASYEMGSGDVKYHQGFSSNVMTPGGEVHLALSFNPSHLEVVSSVVEGSVRARQDRRNDEVGDSVVPIIMHGDAAFAGQGVVMEIFQMSQTRAYKTGGTVHVIINNQVGFTTSRQDDARSTEYCTDVAKMVQAPIFHVNGDDPEAVLFVTQLAMDYRKVFHRDVIIDLICYRRRGHNEADEPSATQPMMYQKIRKQQSTFEQYCDRLVEEGVVDDSECKSLADDYRAALDDGRHVAKSLVMEPNTSLFVDWMPYLGHDWTAAADTGIDKQELIQLADRLEQLPEGFGLQRQLAKLLDERHKMTLGEIPLNWGYAETMAYASLLHQGVRIRITGQDVGRGTFSHRHAVLHDQNNGKSYIPLQHLSPEQPDFVIYDSLLSEMAVLGFEYGYASTSPESLVIWEAQFGDFANGAQVVIDQFVTSGEHKWGRLCGLTMLLPHGYEGQGPEHSSARLERYLQLCAEHNIQVCVPTTSAQMFHLLRRQAIRPLRRPLVVMSPKSLLRHKAAVSTLDELTNGCFNNVLGEIDRLDASKVKRLVLCSGRIYYDLLQTRRKLELDNVAIVRLEQLYPFPEEEMAAVIASYTQLNTAIWCQEEPLNQGAWYSSQHHMRRVISRHIKQLHLDHTGREASAAPAAGYMALHLEQQEKFIQEALVG